MIIGIDLGFGQVKAVGEVDGKLKKFKFASAVGIPTAYEIEESKKKDDGNEQMVVVVDNQTHYIGEKAIKETDNARLTFTAEKTNRTSDKVKYLCVLGHYILSSPSTKHFDIVTGLPVFEYNPLKDKLKANMTNKFQFNYSGVNMASTIDNVVVIPQSAGAYYSAILDDDGKVSDLELASGRVMVIDFGYRTTDVVMMENGKYINHESFTVFRGIYKVHMELRKLLYADPSIQIMKDITEIDEIMKEGYITVLGNKVDISHLIRKAIEPTAMAIIEETEIYVPTHKDIDTILLCGGGATVFYDYIADCYEDANIKILDEPEYANAYGYFKYGKLMLK